MVQQQQPQDVFATNLSFAVSTFKQVTPIQSRAVERTNTFIAFLDGYDKTVCVGIYQRVTRVPQPLKCTIEMSK